MGIRNAETLNTDCYLQMESLRINYFITAHRRFIAIALSFYWEKILSPPVVCDVPLLLTLLQTAGDTFVTRFRHLNPLRYFTHNEYASLWSTLFGRGFLSWKKTVHLFS